MEKQKKYIRCAKKTGQIIGRSFESYPHKLPHTVVFWVEMDENDPFPAARSHTDTISFKLKTPFSDSDMQAKSLVVSKSAGQWKHSETPKQAAASQEKLRAETINKETYQIIKQWCLGQKEGCEEAFLHIGIEHGKDHPRYQVYVQAKQQIIEEQKQKKALR